MSPRPKAVAPRSTPWKILISKKARSCRVPIPWMRGVLKRILEECDAEERPSSVEEVELVVVDDEEMRELNAAYRGKDRPTDVLSFSMLEGGGFPGPSLGSLVISWDTLIRQAKRFGVSEEREFLRLAVHGTLHLFGYDHERVPPAVAARMRRRERRLMEKLRKYVA